MKKKHHRVHATVYKEEYNPLSVFNQYDWDLYKCDKEADVVVNRMNWNWKEKYWKECTFYSREAVGFVIKRNYFGE